jgi:tetratricopeptide (TPR) repeat protein
MDYYRQANEMFHELRDKFGTAYSHCGIGNAYRMKGNLQDALKHFKKASNLYEKIGDVVSYSYTLWSLANVYKMKSDFVNARLYIKKASNNFKRTKDPRGIIYCDLTLGEVDFMEGRKRFSEKRLTSALSRAESHDFKLEKCHCRMLLMEVRGQKGVRKSVKAENCYKKLGVYLDFTGIPFNMP